MWRIYVGIVGYVWSIKCCEGIDLTGKPGTTCRCEDGCVKRVD